MMDKKHLFSAVLGLDIGRVNTRASYFGISEGKYHLLGSESAPTSLGHDLHLGSGVGAALQGLEEGTGCKILKVTGKLLQPVDAAGHGVDQVALMTSVGPLVNTVLLGLTEAGSLVAGQALLNSLPIQITRSFGLDSLGDETGVIESILDSRPQILIITGGEDAGAESPVRQWVEIARLVCRLLPEPLKPLVIFGGNPCLEPDVRRRLEPVAALHIVPNLQPVHGEFDLVPTQALLDGEVLKIWKSKIPGLIDLTHLSKNLEGTKWFTLGRMMRYLSRCKNHDRDFSKKIGVLALDLGGGCTTISAGLDGKVGTVVQPCWDDELGQQLEESSGAVHQWVMAPVTLQAVNQYLANHALTPAQVPETVKELALSQALARHRLQAAIGKLSANYPWFGNVGGKGLVGHYEPVIASGAVLTQAPTPGQAMLILLDGLQPWGVTTMVLDKHHILPLLGMIGRLNPLLPVHVLESDAFENLGTVVSPVSDAPEGETILTVRVKTGTRKDYSVDIVQGTLRRLVMPAGASAVLVLEPKWHTDVGFGERGSGGRLKVSAGKLGVVIDARGRPLKLAAEDEKRVEQLRKWLWALGG